MPTPVTKYHCSFCGHIHDTFQGCAQHESYCGKNPINRQCATCGQHIYNSHKVYDKAYWDLLAKHSVRRIDYPYACLNNGDPFLIDAQRCNCPNWKPKD